MARIRTVKPEMWVDEKLVECCFAARLLFIGLLNFADDDGRMEYRPKKIKMQIFPADDVNITELLGELRREKLVIIYGVEDKEYLQVRGFSKHQKVDKRSKSKFPSPDESHRIPPNPADGRDQGRDQGREGKEGEGKPSLSPEEPATDDGMPACPHMKIIDIYHQTLPTLPRVVKELWHESESATHLKARWRTLPAHQDLDFWREYFEVVKTNPHWLGENDRAWTASLHWLVNRTNFNKVMTRWNSLMEAA